MNNSNTLVLMQPYIFPYLGYYQLAQASDIFVFYDDVSFIKQGYINRNNILSGGKSQRFTIPLNGASSNKQINEIFISDKVGKILKTIEQSYSKSPNFCDVFPMIERVILPGDKRLSVVASNSIVEVFKYLNIERDFKFSSDLDYDRSQSAKDKIISICKVSGSKNYINSLGGQELYSKSDFENSGIKLSFLKKNSVLYKQGHCDFIDNLSIIDILMWCDREEVIDLLTKYELV